MRVDKKCLHVVIWFAFIVIYFLWDLGEWASGKIGFLNGLYGIS